MRCYKYLNKPILILTCGLTGTGKSTIALEIQKITGISFIRSDVVRKQLAHLEEGDHRLDNFGKGIYSDEFFNMTYDTIFNIASERLQKGEPVLIDASFKKRRYRERAKKLALEFSVPFLLIECKCSKETARERLLKRSVRGDDPSDGRWEIYEKQKTDFENITEFSNNDHLVLNTDIEISINVNKAIKAIENIQSEWA